MESFVVHSGVFTAVPPSEPGEQASEGSPLCVAVCAHRPATSVGRPSRPAVVSRLLVCAALVALRCAAALRHSSSALAHRTKHTSHWQVEEARSTSHAQSSEWTRTHTLPSHRPRRRRTPPLRTDPAPPLHSPCRARSSRDSIPVTTISQRRRQHETGAKAAVRGALQRNDLRLSRLILFLCARLCALPFAAGLVAMRIRSCRTAMPCTTRRLVPMPMRTG